MRKCENKNKKFLPLELFFFFLLVWREKKFFFMKFFLRDRMCEGFFAFCQLTRKRSRKRLSVNVARTVCYIPKWAFSAHFFSSSSVLSIFFPSFLLNFSLSHTQHRLCFRLLPFVNRNRKERTFEVLAHSLVRKMLSCWREIWDGEWKLWIYIWKGCVRGLGINLFI